MSSKHQNDWQFQYAAAGWIVPGLGHILLGHARRGAILMIAIYTLFVAGLLIGGIDVVASKDLVSTSNGLGQKKRLWFYAQILVGPPSLIIDQLKDPKDVLEAPTPPGEPANPYSTAPQQQPPRIKAVGRPEELGTLFCAMAGMLNLLVMIDALTRQPLKKGDGDKPTDKGGRLVTREGR